MMLDGTVKPVEDVACGDLLMGPDSTPRRVLGTCRGRSPLYRIRPLRGEPWICNDVHVLTLVETESGRVIDIDLPSYLAQSKWFRHTHKQFTPENGIDFEAAAPLPLDPYFLGVWYGDGTKSLSGVMISKPDPEIAACVATEAARWGLRFTVYHGPTCPTYRVSVDGGVNPLLRKLRAIVGAGTHLPHAYLTASRADRSAFLAGLLDTDGYRIMGTGYEIAQKERGYADGIVFLARSLGLSTSMVVKHVKGVPYWRITISGDCSSLPMRIARKKPEPRRQKKVATRTGFTVEPIGEGDYAGFELDGDGRFLLGDFTVTHNTATASEIMRSAVEKGRRVLFLVHRREIVNDTARRLRAADVPCGVLMAGVRTAGDPPVTVASIQTVVARRRSLAPTS
jgi:hypothetical protein